MHKLAREDAFGLLRATPKYLSNVTLRPDGLDPEPLVLDVAGARLSDLALPPGEVIPLTELIDEDPDTRELWLELKRRGATGLSGVQPKLPVHLHAAGEELRLSLGHVTNTSTHILKLPSRDYPELVQNEWATMELARKIGLGVASLRQVSFQPGSPLGQPALLIERFDVPRRVDGTEELFLLEEASSLLGILRKDKYATSIEKVAAALVKAGLAPEELERFFDHVVFSWTVGNGDLHAKNIAVLHRIRPGLLGLPPACAGAEYSPLYDLVNTRAVLAGDLFALPLNGKQNNLRTKDFAALGRKLGLDGRYARERAAEIAAAVRENVDAVLEQSHLSAPMREKYAAVIRTTANL